MPASPVSGRTGGPAATGILNARRLIQIRMIAVPVPAVCLLLARYPMGFDLPALSLSVIVVALLVFNVWAWRRFARRSSISDNEFFLQIVVDVIALTGTLYYTGGGASPFVFFCLMPLTITAVSMPRRYTWAMAVISALAYTFLLTRNAGSPTLPAFTDRPFRDTHIMGMWVGFIVIAGLTAHFVAAMAETVRQRDRYLSELREAALRDERVVALATLAAGAAHELGTPLATMAVLAGEIGAEYPLQQYPRLHRQLDILTEQIGRCKEALSVMSASAGAARAEVAERLSLDQFVAGVVEEVRRLRSSAGVKVRIVHPPPAPVIVVERTIRQALLNIIHNAVDVSPEQVAVEGDWDDEAVEIRVVDAGGGMRIANPGSLERLGTSTKAGGLGLGLFLAHAVIEHMGGKLTACDNTVGGTTVTLRLPLAKLMEGA